MHRVCVLENCPVQSGTYAIEAELNAHILGKSGEEKACHFGALLMLDDCMQYSCLENCCSFMVAGVLEQ